MSKMLQFMKLIGQLKVRENTHSFSYDVGMLRIGLAINLKDFPENMHTHISHIEKALSSACMQRVPRTGWVYRSIQQPESVSDHMYRMSMMALTITDSSINKDR